MLTLKSLIQEGEFKNRYLPVEFCSHGRGGFGRPATVPAWFATPFSSTFPVLATPALATVAAVLAVFDGGANGDGPLVALLVDPARSQGLRGAWRPAFQT
jgi:hypothetical protein